MLLDVRQLPIALRPEQTDAAFPRHWPAGATKYTDFAPLAQGGTSEVQACFDKNLKRRVAIKRLHPHLRNDDLETRRFLREARVTAMIAHPGTPSIHEIGRDAEGTLYFTMKLLRGRDLRAILKDLAAHDEAVLAAFALPRLIDVLISVGQTVAYAHCQGVVHRDLKPANILVGGFGEVTVLDWGLAKVAGDAPVVTPASTRWLPEDAQGFGMSDMTATQPGRRYGTPMYMSPEQAVGDSSLDERSDVYSLGLILYEMLALKPAVWPSDLTTIVQRVCHEASIPPSRCAPPGREVPTALEAICLKALAKDRTQRYANAALMAEDLLRFREGRPVSAYREPLRGKWARFRDRHARLLTTLPAALAGALAVWWWFVLR